jgi:hypothetical protein
MHLQIGSLVAGGMEKCPHISANESKEFVSNSDGQFTSVDYDLEYTYDLSEHEDVPTNQAWDKRRSRDRSSLLRTLF